MNRAALYARVSTAKQEQDETIQVQLEEIMKRISSDGLALLEDNIYCDDGWTGTLLERPGLDRLRQDARSKKFDSVYVYDRGRLSRIFVHQEIIISELGELGIEFTSLKDGTSNSPEEKMTQSFLGLFQEYERTKITERFRLGKLSKVKRGELLGYNAPYGYDYIPISRTSGNKENGFFQVNEGEAKIVRDIFSWIVRDHLSLNDVVRKLDQEKIAPPKRMSETWAQSTIRRLVRNKSYIGQHAYNKRESVVGDVKYGADTTYKRIKKNSRRTRPESEWISIEIPKILDDEIFYRVQDILEENKKFSRKNTKREYLLRGLTYCSCGHTRRGDTAGNGFSYYRCNEKMHSFPRPATCAERGQKVSMIDELVWREIQKLFNHEYVAGLASEWLKNRPTVRAPKPNANNSRARAELDSRELDCYERHRSGRITDHELISQLNEIKSLRLELGKKNETRVDELHQSDINCDELSEAAIKHISQLDGADKLPIVRNLIDKVIINKMEVRIYGSIKVPISEKVGLDAIPRYRGSAKRW